MPMPCGCIACSRVHRVALRPHRKSGCRGPVRPNSSMGDLSYRSRSQCGATGGFHNSGCQCARCDCRELAVDAPTGCEKIMPTKAKRLLWIVNHKTLLPAEVPIFRDLGYEVFIPKIIPTHASYRSGTVTYDYDLSLTIPRRDLEILNSHAFYGELDLY